MEALFVGALFWLLPSREKLFSRLVKAVGFLRRKAKRLRTMPENTIICRLDWVEVDYLMNPPKVTFNLLLFSKLSMFDVEVSSVTIKPSFSLHGTGVHSLEEISTVRYLNIPGGGLGEYHVTVHPMNSLDASFISSAQRKEPVNWILDLEWRMRFAGKDVVFQTEVSREEIPYTRIPQFFRDALRDIRG